jgi:hypothetical protein
MPWYLETDRTDNNGEKKANCYLWTSGKVREGRWIDTFVFDKPTDPCFLRKTSALPSYLVYNCRRLTNADVPLQVERDMTKHVWRLHPELVLDTENVIIKTPTQLLDGVNQQTKIVLVYTPFKGHQAAVYRVNNLNLSADMEPYKTGRNAVKLFEGSNEQCFGFALGLAQMRCLVKTAACEATGDVTNYAWTADTSMYLQLDLNASSPVKQFQLIG